MSVFPTTTPPLLPLLLLPVFPSWFLGSPPAVVEVGASPDVPEGQKAWEYLAYRLDINIQASPANVTITINNQRVYSSIGGDDVDPSGLKRPHSGLHLVAVDVSRGGRVDASKEGRVLLTRRFLTYQPAEHQDLATVLGDIQPGRLLLLAGVPEWVMFLGRAGREALTALGFRWPLGLTTGEAWVGAAWKGRGGVVGEAASTISWLQNPTALLTLELSVPIPVHEEYRCDWHMIPELAEQRAFCQQYEGYGDLCRCGQPFTASIRYQQEEVVMSEEIPVVIVTATKPHHLYRLVRNLFTIAGGGQTSVLVAADGGDPETLALSRVLGISTVAHQPQGTGNNRTNANVRFALYTVFSHFPQVDKAIVLEDDLLLSPDFFSFFHQAAWVLNNDPTVFCVNAFNSNSLPHIASDPSQLLRSESFPMYGWMVRRSYARQIVINWIPLGPGDWDWYLMRAWSQRGSDVVSPEVSRTLHAGNAGAHVDGFEQHLYYSQTLTTTTSNISLHNLSGILLSNYQAALKEELLRAEVVEPDPRDENFLPKGRPGPFVTFVRAGTRNDEFFGIRIFLMSIGSYYWDTREIFRGVMRLRVTGRLFYIVGCPLSELFCPYKPPGVPVLSPSPELIKGVVATNNDYEKSLYEYGRGRSHGQSLYEYGAS